MCLYAPRQDQDAGGGDAANGYLYVSGDQPWPLIRCATGTGSRLLVRRQRRTGARTVLPRLADYLPREVWLGPDGTEMPARARPAGRVRARAVPVLPALPGLLRAGPRQDFAKLATLDAEGRVRP